MSVSMHEAIDAMTFIRNACVRLNDMRAVQSGDKEMLTDELDSIEAIAASFLTAAGHN